VTEVETEFRRLGPYVLLRASGAGGMARIDLALRGAPETADVCVLKRLHADYRSPEQEARFRREAAIARRLSHDAIARTLGVDEVDGEVLLLQELVMGVDLRRLSARVAAIGERLPVPLAVYIVSEVARALHYAHTFRRLGIVHRDVTPDNIMLAFSGAVKLIDFGIARSDVDATVTQAGFVVGRPTYTAPEVWNGARADRRSDIYSLGVVLWQLLTGRPLEPGDAASSLSKINPDVPPALAAVNLRAFDADPAGRYQSASAFHQALADHLPGKVGARAQLSELLARHFDVGREQRMLAEDVAHAKPLLAIGNRADRPKTVMPAKGRTRRAWFIAAAALLLTNAALIRLGSRGAKSPMALPAPRPPQRPPATPTPGTTISAAAPEAPKLSAIATASASPRTVPRTSAPRAAAPGAATPGKSAHGAPPAIDIKKSLSDAQDNFDRGDLATALALARNAAHNGAGDPAYILIGTIMMNGRHYDEAERAFTEAVRLDPEDARAARLLAVVKEIRKMGDVRP
jgi:eukaryotic-like serine/threonine-protein kinase